MKVTGMWYKTLILLLILLNIGCDQVSKYLVRGNIAYYEHVELIKDNLILTCFVTLLLLGTRPLWYNGISLLQEQTIAH